jgi:hypothetical protein
MVVSRIITMCLLLGLYMVSFHAEVIAQTSQTELREFEITPVSASETIAVFPDFPDKAAIIFTTTITNLQFDSQMNGIVQVRDESSVGRYILIIEPFTQVISITAPGFIQERLRVGNPVARDVRQYRVSVKRSTIRSDSCRHEYYPFECQLVCG